MRPDPLAAGAVTGHIMKVLFATSECAPWVKTGGLGDVSAALPAALRDGGTDVRVLLPFYPALRAQFPHAPVLAHLRGLGGELPDATLRLAQADSGVPLLLLDNATCYQRPGSPYAAPDDRDWRDNDVRFGLLARAAAWLGGSDCTLDWQCDIVHCNDWQSALAPAYLHYLHSPGARRARTVMTVHNIAFQGMFDRVSLGRVGLPDEAWRFDSVEFHGWLSFLKAGLQHADALTTVSPTYAHEILTDEGGMGLAGLLRWRRNALVGILNGIDTKQWDPATDPLIEHHYDGAGLDAKRANKTALQRQLGLVPRDDRPLLGVVSRMTAQKGLDLLLPIADALAALPVQLVMLGTGDPALEVSPGRGRSAASRRIRHRERLRRDAGAPHRSRRRHFPDAVPLRAMRTEPAVQPALRHTARRIGSRRSGRHGDRLQRCRTARRHGQRLRLPRPHAPGTACHRAACSRGVAAAGRMAPPAAQRHAGRARLACLSRPLSRAVPAPAFTVAMNRRR
jgi:starch synthase